MGYYNVVRPCVVGKLHYASVPSQPIEVDDEVAAPLVESGDLAVYQPGCYVAPQIPSGWVEGATPTAGGPYDVSDGEPTIEDFAYGGPAANPKPRPRRPRKSAED